MTHTQQLAFPAPTARRTDPGSSLQAAIAVAPGNEDCVNAVRRWFAHNGPHTEEECALSLVPDERVSRWRRSTVVSACARAGLVAVGTDVNQRNRTVTVYGLPIESTRSL